MLLIFFLVGQVPLCSEGAGVLSLDVGFPPAPKSGRSHTCTCKSEIYYYLESDVNNSVTSIQTDLCDFRLEEGNVVRTSTVGPTDKLKNNNYELRR